MSGRALRRLPVLALARHIEMGRTAVFQFYPTEALEPSRGIPVEAWLEGLELAVNDIVKEKEIIT